MLEPVPQPKIQPQRQMLSSEPDDAKDQLSFLETGAVLFQPEAVPAPSGKLSGYNLFLAIFPQPEIAHRVSVLGGDLVKQHGMRGQRLQEHHLHMTLHAVAWFDDKIPLQEIEATRAAAAGARCPTLAITFDRVGSFYNRGNPGNNAFVLRCDARSETSVARLRQQLGVALRRSDLHPKPTASPHMTLLYDRKLIEEQPIEPIQWTATRFALILSHVGLGHHQWLGEWQLG